ncbi:Cerato-platanin [Lactarius indigo]|nr:Cerato-platanin [Lactarius indigo]
MKLTSTLTSLVALFSVASAVNVRYDTTYDNPQGSLSTFGSLPSFPNIGAAQAVAGWNSTACGSCWKISFGGKSINVIAVDHAGDGFNLSLEAMDTLTNGQAQQLGVINAQATQVDASQCGL